MGFPTKHSGCWLPPGIDDGLGDDPFLQRCYTDSCHATNSSWHDLAKHGETWTEMLAKQPECIACAAERRRRCRLIAESDQRVLRPPFLDAPYVHQNNQPKYHAMLLRSVEWAKRHGPQPLQILWITAYDEALNNRDIGKTDQEVRNKLTRFLQFHDQQTEGIPGLFPLYEGLRVRVTEKIKKSAEVMILKHMTGTVTGYSLHAGDDVQDRSPEKLLQYMPPMILVRVDGATFQLPGFPEGVYPFTPVERTWLLNKTTGAKICRKGFTLVPDFASTAFMIQGSSLDNMVAECGSMWQKINLHEMITSYVILSRLKSASGLLLLRAFSPFLFRQGVSPGPGCLRKLLLARFDSCGRVQKTQTYTQEAAEAEYNALNAKCEAARGTIGQWRWPCAFCE